MKTINTNILKNNEIEQYIKEQLVLFKQLHLLIDPKINDSLLFNPEYIVGTTTVIRDRQDVSSLDCECLQLITFNNPLSLPTDLFVTMQKENSAIVGLFFSQHSLLEIKAQLINAMFMQHDGRFYLFRYYDPIVLNELLSIFDKDQFDKLLGVIEKWIFWRDDFIEINHTAQLVLSDIDYRIGSEQWRAFIAAQRYNFYSAPIFLHKNNKKVLSAEQRKRLHALFFHPVVLTMKAINKDKLDYLALYVMDDIQQNFQQMNHKQLFQLLLGETSTMIKKIQNI